MRAATSILFVLTTTLAAQQPNAAGRITGRVVDAATGTPIAGTQVDLLGKVGGVAVAAVTEWSGRYTLSGVPPGRHSVTLRMIGYRSKTVSDVVVQDGIVTLLDATLDAAVVELEGIVVSAEVERGSVSRALDEQRTATQIVNAISAEQIRRSPDGDAGQAVQRISGVTVQDGKYVFVRGLGERYTTTSLNNVRIPSPEPERKVVPLDLFPAGLLQSIVTSKTFTPEQPGDLSGAQVDLRTRDFPTSRVLSLSLATGVNDAVTFQPVLAAPRVGSEWWGFAGRDRALPAVADRSLAGLTQGDLNNIIASFRNAWTPWIERAKPNGSFGLSLGGEDLVAGRPLGYVAALSYSESQETRRQEERATTRSDGSLLEFSRGSTGTVSVLWGGLLNLSARLGPTSTLSLNNTYTRSADNQATRHIAYDEEFSPSYGLFDATRLTMVERTVRSNQVRGEHLLADRHSLVWSLTSSAVTRYEPDRSDLRYETDSLGSSIQPTAWFGQARSAVRTFSDLDERALETAAAVGFGFGAPARQGRIKIGGSYRHTVRDADTRAFDIVNHPATGLTDAERHAGPDQVFSGTHTQDSAFYVYVDNLLGRYRAGDDLVAGFVQAEIPLSARVRIIGGARIERWMLDLTTSLPGAAPVVRRNTDVLPALAVNVTMSDAHRFRISASQTLARPEYRELSPTGYRDFIGGLDVFGNTALRRALIRNVDARWEWYPSAGEIVSLGAFAKDFEKPIEKVIVGTTGGETLSFVNADGATSFGLELELRKNLITLAPALAPISVFANTTVMRSRIRPGSANLTNADRAMVGQAGYVVNAGLGYTATSGGWSATLLYNVVGRRVAEAGSNPRPDAYEEARHLIDLSAQVSVAGGVTLKLDAKNLLDSPVHITQGPVTRLRYAAGRVFSLGASWQP